MKKGDRVKLVRTEERLDSSFGSIKHLIGEKATVEEVLGTFAIPIKIKLDNYHKVLDQMTDYIYVSENEIELI